jgi:hypothetical protein
MPLKGAYLHASRARPKGRVADRSDPQFRAARQAGRGRKRTIFNRCHLDAMAVKYAD